MPALIHLISAVTWGGGERYALDICRHFRAKGWQVQAYTRDSNAVDLPFEREGVKIRHLPLRGYTDMLSPLRLAKMLKSRPADTVIHVHKYKDAFTALLARKLAGRKDVRVVLTRHLVKPAKRGWLARRIYRNLDAQIFVSALARDRFMSVWKGEPLPFHAQRMHTLHNSLYGPTPDYTPPPAKGPRIILFLGRLAPEKGIETLLEALPALRGRRARAWICGTGQADYVDLLKRTASRLGVMDLIDWKGHVADADAAIRACHVAVLPSVGEESFGLANIEVMRMGRAQICTSNGAQREYMRAGRDAMFIAPRDSEALSRLLTEMLDDPSSPSGIEKMGLAARRTYMETLEWQRFATRLEAIYRS